MRPALLGRRATLISMLALAAITGMLLLLLPPEATLGRVIAPIFLHGALVEVGMLVFAAGALLGIAYLLRRSHGLARWNRTLQLGGVVVWILYTLSSMVATRLSWGEWIAWTEPRVQASALVLGFCVVALLFAIWVSSSLFTALANVAVGSMAWYLVKGASLLRHPFDPVGMSSSDTYQEFYVALVVLVLLLVVQMIRWLHTMPTGNGFPRA